MDAAAKGGGALAPLNAGEVRIIGVGRRRFWIILGLIFCRRAWQNCKPAQKSSPSLYFSIRSSHIDNLASGLGYAGNAYLCDHQRATGSGGEQKGLEIISSLIESL